MQIECKPEHIRHRPGRPRAMPLDTMVIGEWFHVKENVTAVRRNVYNRSKATGRRFVLLPSGYVGTAKVERIAHNDPRRAVGDPPRPKVKALKGKRRLEALNRASIAALQARRHIRLAALKHPDIFA